MTRVWTDFNDLADDEVWVLRSHSDGPLRKGDRVIAWDDGIEVKAEVRTTDAVGVTLHVDRSTVSYF